MLPPRLPRRRPASTRPTASGCARPGCNAEPVVRLDWDGIVLAFCTAHAEDKAAQSGAQIVWVSAGCLVCPRCARVIDRRLMGRHYTAQGEPCWETPPRRR